MEVGWEFLDEGLEPMVLEGLLVVFGVFVLLLHDEPLVDDLQPEPLNCESVEDHELGV